MANRNRAGGQDLARQLNPSTNFVQNSFNSSQGIISDVPTLLFKGVVIDVDFNIVKTTTEASVIPPFSVYAKIIGLDEDTPDPMVSRDKVFYPPLFSMHSICIPEVGEEVLILKEDPSPSSAGYYIGRVNDSIPLNISYARDYTAINDSSAPNTVRYGFSFDVRELRKKRANISPSTEFSNISIPMTFGDVVQQGRSKTYVRHSFNRNNKKGVLEQGIRLDGQLSQKSDKNTFNYDGPGANLNGNTNPTRQRTYIDSETGEVEERVDIINDNYGLGSNTIKKLSIDPTIGTTNTKNIHLVDSSIKRIGNYNYQSMHGNQQTNELEGADKAMIINIADEIYNISSRDVTGSLYRHVLGEKLVTQQKQNNDLINELLTTVAGFAETTQKLLDVFLDHTHALPKIEINKQLFTVVKDTYRTPPRFRRQKPLRIRIPPRNVTIPGTPGTDAVMGKRLIDPHPQNSAPIYEDYVVTPGTGGTPAQTVTVPSGWASVPQPPKLVSTGKYVTRRRINRINFREVIGGERNPRFTAPVQTELITPAPRPMYSGGYGQQANPVVSEEVTSTELGIKTGEIDKSLQEVIERFSIQQENLGDLSRRVSNFLSKNQFVN